MALPIETQNIIKILGIESLPDEEKLKLLEQISDIVQQRLLLRLADSVGADKQAELRAVLDKQDQKALEEFVQKNAPDFGTWTEEEVGKLKRELADLVSK